jgi:hypothetical protein
MDEDPTEVARRLRREMRIATTRLREAWTEDDLSPTEIPVEVAPDGEAAAPKA